MTAKVEATYSEGMLKLSSPLPLPENSVVHLIVDLPDENDRAGWLRGSQNGLQRIWDNDADDAFNELR